MRIISAACRISNYFCFAPYLCPAWFNRCRWRYCEKSFSAFLCAHICAIFCRLVAGQHAASRISSNGAGGMRRKEKALTVGGRLSIANNAHGAVGLERCGMRWLWASGQHRRGTPLHVHQPASKTALYQRRGTLAARAALSAALTCRSA